MHNDPTLAAPSTPFDATVDGRSALAAHDGSVREAPAHSVPVSSHRTTVLPRVEWSGATPSLVRSSRPRFERKQTLGEGGVGEVSLALDHDIGREVAIKRLRAGTANAGALARFVDEIRTVGALEHPNVAPIHDVGVDEQGELYFVMKRVEGETLESIIDRLRKGDPLAHAHFTFERRAHIFRQLLDAVAFAHERGFVHRDIKPANVMVGAFGEVFLMDWGIAKTVDGPDSVASSGAPEPPPASSAVDSSKRVSQTHAGAILGTPAYMSPEQARGERVDARSDIYSLCVLFHELLCLEHYLGDRQTLEAVLAGVIDADAPVASFVPNPHQPPAPAELSWFIRKGLTKDPAGRFQSVREMIERLDARDDGVFPVQCPVTFTKRVGRGMLRFVDRHPGLFTFGFLAGVVLFLTAVVLAAMRFV